MREVSAQRIDGHRNVDVLMRVDTDDHAGGRLDEGGDVRHVGGLFHRTGDRV